ncbi:MAG: PAS domain S-box protein [Gemmatimonadales bacterium]
MATTARLDWDHAPGSPLDPRALRACARVARASSVAVMVLSVLVLGGWAIGSTTATSWQAGWPPMRPLSAVCTGLLGVALLRLTQRDRLDPIGTGAALVVGFVVCLTILEHATGVDLGIDHVLFPGAALWASEVQRGRIPALSAVTLGLLALGLAVQGSDRRQVWIRQGALVLTALSGVVSLEGYVLRLAAPEATDLHGSMSLFTALALLLLGLGGIAAAPTTGLPAPFIRDTPISRTSRQMLPIMVGATLLVAWLAEYGERHGIYTSAVGTALLATIMVTALLAAMALGVERVNRLESIRQVAEAQILAEAHRTVALSAVVETSDDPILTKTLDGEIRSWNGAAERLYGYAASEVLGKNVSLLVPPERQPELAGLLQRLRRGEAIHHLETVRRTRDGRLIDVSLSLSPVSLGPGEPVGAAVIARDITARKENDRRLRESEERLNSVVESLSEGLVISDLDGKLLHWNRAGLKIHGFDTMDDLLRPVMQSEQLFELSTLDGQVLTVGEWPLSRLLQGETVRDLDLRVRRRDKPWERILRYGGSLVSQPGGGRLAVLSIADLTDRWMAENRFRLVVEACPTGIAVVNEHGLITMVNGEFERMFGWSREDLVGQSVECLIPTPLREGHAGLRQGYQQSEARPRRMGTGRDLVGRRQDGTEFPVEVGLTPMLLGGERSVLAVVTDITERQAAADLLARHQRELERSNQELAQFAYVASHDLQEPLRMVSSYTELFVDRYMGQVDERAAKYLKYITDGARRMQQLIHDLLSYARVESQGKPLVPTPVAANLAVVQHDLGAAVKDAGGTIEAGPLPEVWADPGQLRQLLQNLLANAVKFRSPERPVRVAIRAVGEGKQVRLSVSDNGIGIPPEFAERVFAMFQRLHTREEYDGSGIGLSIARRIVERHGGRIWIEPSDGPGTTVVFTLWPANGPKPAR